MGRLQIATLAIRRRLAVALDAARAGTRIVLKAIINLASPDGQPLSYDRDAAWRVHGDVLTGISRRLLRSLARTTGTHAELGVYLSRSGRGGGTRGTICPASSPAKSGCRPMQG